MRLNEEIVDIEKPDGICFLTFIVDDFSGLFLHPSIFCIKHSRSAPVKSDALSDFLILMFHVSAVLRLFMMFFRYGLILLR